MLQSVWNGIAAGRVNGIVLLGIAIGLFLYFLPAVLSFLKGQKRFWAILLLNLCLTFVQSAILQKLFPGLFAVQAGDLAGTLLVSVIVNFGVGWAALLLWALRPGESDPRLLRAGQTKTYDTVAALPLILWFVYGAMQLRATLAHDAVLMASGSASLFIWVQFFSLLAAIAFYLLLVYLLIVRAPPIAKSKGVLPRLFAFLGTFMGVAILQVPVAALSLPMQILAAVLIGVGSLGSFLVLWRLGKSFSIMPEARKLVTAGPYAYARHPLYAVEMITIVGTALQFQAPWSWVLAATVLALLWARSHFEEQVLAEAFPEYGAYRAKTARFIPGII
ncbi:MAG TPA: isoprenylcysteine carboxylmethyltransferase family protein [Rhizomicrobium sp.]|nr:isoprenylcysteine carboxylmethyltransferase family protein [Rhizomicrobium sp.]